MTLTLSINKTKKVDYKMKPPLTEKIQKYVFPEFSSRINRSCYPVSGEVLVTERMPAISLFHFCSSLSSDGSQILVSDQVCFLKMFGHNNVSLAITSAISGVQNNSKYSRGLLGSSKSTFMPGLPVNGKRGHSAPNFAYMPGCMLLFSLTFSSSSELMLCSIHDGILTFISLLLLYMLSEISLY
jgi:hypothetical protein